MLNQLEHQEIQHLYALHSMFFSYIYSVAILEHFRAVRLSREIFISHLRIVVFNVIGCISVTKPCQTIHLFHNILL